MVKSTALTVVGSKKYSAFPAWKREAALLELHARASRHRGRGGGDEVPLAAHPVLCSVQVFFN